MTDRFVLLSRLKFSVTFAASHTPILRTWRGVVADCSGPKGAVSMLAEGNDIVAGFVDRLNPQPRADAGRPASSLRVAVLPIRRLSIG